MRARPSVRPTQSEHVAATAFSGWQVYVDGVRTLWGECPYCDCVYAHNGAIVTKEYKCAIFRYCGTLKPSIHFPLPPFQPHVL